MNDWNDYAAPKLKQNFRTTVDALLFEPFRKPMFYDNTFIASETLVKLPSDFVFGKCFNSSSMNATIWIA